MKNTTNDTKTQVLIYTDGSCLGNPGPGGWAVRLESCGKVRFLQGGFAHTTNNRMEIYAAIQALKSLTRPCNVVLYTDSRYVCDAIAKGWLYGWKKRGWIKADKKPVLNRDLWELLYPLLAYHTVEFKWVEAHVGHIHNEEVDTLARAEASKTGNPPDEGFLCAAD